MHHANEWDDPAFLAWEEEQEGRALFAEQFAPPLTEAEEQAEIEALLASWPLTAGWEGG